MPTQAINHSLPCALEGHNWEHADRRPRPAAPAEGAAESPPNRSESSPEGRKSAAVWVRGAGLPRPRASDRPRAPVSAAACTPRTRSPSGLPAAGFLSPPPTGLRWTRATWCPWGRRSNSFLSALSSFMKMISISNAIWWFVFLPLMIEDVNKWQWRLTGQAEDICKGTAGLWNLPVLVMQLHNTELWKCTISHSKNLHQKCLWLVYFGVFPQPF